MTFLEWVAVIEAIIIWTGSGYYNEQIGDLEAKLTQAEVIVNECATTRTEARERSIAASADREANRPLVNQIIAGEVQQPGHVAEVGPRSPCAGLGARLSGGAEREVQRTKELNEYWLRQSAPESGGAH